METKVLILKEKRDFNITVCLIGVIPCLVFLYLLVCKVSSFQVLVGEIGYILFFTIVVFILGIVLGRKMLMSLIQELIEKNRLAAITETTLALGHEINNPLVAINGNFALLESETKNTQVPQKIRDRLNVIKENFERIRVSTEKMDKLSKPVTSPVFGSSRMLDLSNSL